MSKNFNFKKYIKKVILFLLFMFENLTLQGRLNFMTLQTLIRYLRECCIQPNLIIKALKLVKFYLILKSALL